MTADSEGLGAYLDRIGHDGDPQPTLATLDAVIARHTATIAFENLDPFLGVVPDLDPSALQAKLVRHGRGGWCFEQNLLLRSALRQLGFTVTALAARVVWGAEPDAITRRSHMLLLVEVEGSRRIADVGFGGMVLTSSLAFEPGTAQQTPLEQFRIVELDGAAGEYAQQVLVDGEWRSTYRFDLQPQYPLDYEAANWYLATSPSSHFISNLMVARATADRRYTLSGTRLTVRHLDGGAERHSVGSPADLRRRLEEDFLIDTSGLAGLDEAFGRLV